MAGEVEAGPRRGKIETSRIDGTKRNQGPEEGGTEPPKFKRPERIHPF